MEKVFLFVFSTIMLVLFAIMVANAYVELVYIPFQKAGIL